MAAEFLRSHGIDINAEMAAIQHGLGSSGGPATRTEATAVNRISKASLPGTPPGSLWDLTISKGKIENVTEHAPKADQTSGTFDVHSALVATSLCHPHLHLDKAYLLSHPRYAHLRVSKGGFQEAMQVTTEAKSNFDEADLLERGQRVIDESVTAGVTHMRAFVEVDVGVGLKCLDAAIVLKQRAEGRCKIQLCAFAQLPLFSPSDGDEQGAEIRHLMEHVASMAEVECLGSTPYVESSDGQTIANIDWMIQLTERCKKHLDFHLDYNVDQIMEPKVWNVLSALKASSWREHNPNRTVVLGHCTRLTLFSDDQWKELAARIKDPALPPISFVGLPTSDLYMMNATLKIPELIEKLDLNACVGINNIGNAFTPQGSCDPLTLACNGVGVYSAGTERDAEVLYESVSTRAKQAIGLGRDGDRQGEVDLHIKAGDGADLVLFHGVDGDWRTRRSVAEAVYLYDSCQHRRTLLAGHTPK